ncbi:hypothetical protein [Xanthomonas sp. XNM01]|uniref:hypothetical protein n=1 Tax=Xanthomonas sp. XNM01 TaxID=2769289 RepID=UPI00177F458D|nr:hypothetical protein [Xanthomonas sp. XNM01]MBD9368857.1 hypothetical protein [Xanthomonas sp. XNM01]
MPSPREVLLGAVSDCLSRIRTADGYQTNAGAGVTLEPAPALEGDAAFIAVVWASQARPTEPAVSRTHRLTTVRIVAHVPARLHVAREVIDQITGDIERAMADQAYRYPQGYSVPQYQSAEPIVGASTDRWVGVGLTYISNIPIQ